MFGGAMGAQWLEKLVDDSWRQYNINEQQNFIESNARDDRAHQREMAQMGVRWRAEDARAAGLHPLAAMGANLQQASSTVGGGYGIPEGGSRSGVGDSYSQDLTRAQLAGASDEERQRLALQDSLAVERLQMEKERNDAEIALLNSQRARLSGDQMGPPIPRSDGSSAVPGLVGQGDVGSGRYVVKPSEITSSDPVHTARTAGPAAPTMRRHRIGGSRFGFNLDLPASDDPLESAGELMSPALIILHNILSSLPGQGHRPVQLSQSVLRRMRAQGDKSVKVRYSGGRGGGKPYFYK